MATYALIHGAGDVGWYWHLVEAELRARGHDTVAPDLPCDDDSAGLRDYADVVVDAIGDRRPVVVAQSAGAFTAPLVCERSRSSCSCSSPGSSRRPARHRRTGGRAPATRRTPARRGDEIAIFYHDVPPALAAEALERGRSQSSTPTREPWPLDAWPDVPTRFVLCRDDRLLPAAFLRRVVHERLGIVPDEIDAGHCVALSRPAELAALLDGYRR